MTEFKFSLRISRSTNNTGDPRVMRVYIEDDTNGVLVFEGWMTLGEYANVVTGMEGTGAGKLWGVDKVNKRLEHKEELIIARYDVSDEDKAALIAPYEVDGWTARISDLGNGHRRDKKNTGYMVTFSRYVD